MNNENLYETVKNKICDEIFAGHYDDGDKIPPERELEDILNVSRVTVRKSLEILEEERLIVREVGRGTRITLHNCGNKSDLDMIVLIAPARNPFFSEFIARFQSYAQSKGSLILYVEKPRTEELESCLYRLYKRGLRNVVVWLEDLPVDREKLKRLRAIGMNMVFFDTDKGLPFADCVALDNEGAIQALYAELTHLGRHRIGYIGWDLEDSYSLRLREETYTRLAVHSNFLLHLPWKKRKQCEQLAEEALAKLQEGHLEAVICSDRESGELVIEAAGKLKADISIATVDEVSVPDKRRILMYQQDLNSTVRSIFTCLENQCVQENMWNAQMCRIEGQIKNTTIEKEEAV